MGIAITRMISISMRLRSSVTGSRSRILSSTGRPSGWNERLVVGEDLLQSVIVLDPLLLDTGHPSRFELGVRGGVGIADVVHLLRRLLGGMPNHVLIGIDASSPPEHDGLKPPLAD